MTNAAGFFLYRFMPIFLKIYAWFNVEPLGGDAILTRLSKSPYCNRLIIMYESI